MARIADEKKLDSIKKSLIDIIIRDGASNASIAKIAEDANVSVGYLYRHYDSKESLLNDLYLEKFLQIDNILMNEIDKNTLVQKAVFGFYSNILKIIESNENEILFLLKMMTDYSIKISKEMSANLTKTIEFFKGKFKNQISKEVENEQIFIQILGSFLLFINLRKRGVLKDSPIVQDDIQSLTQMTINALK